MPDSPAKKSRKELRLMLLNCDDSEMYGQMLPGMVQDWLGSSLCTVDSVCVLSPEALPSVKTLQDYDGIVVGGAPVSAYDDLPWLEPLRALLRDVAADDRLPHMLGLCFGHQIIAHALGGEVKKNVDHGFQVGARRWQVESDVMPEMSSVRGLVAHGDVVTSLPPDAVHLGGSSPVCKHEGFRAAGGRILTVQYHPEFGGSDAGNKSYKHVIDFLLKADLIDKGAAEKALADVGTTIADDKRLADIAMAHFKARCTSRRQTSGEAQTLIKTQ